MRTMGLKTQFNQNKVRQTKTADCSIKPFNNLYIQTIYLSFPINIIIFVYLFQAESTISFNCSHSKYIYSIPVLLPIPIILFVRATSWNTLAPLKIHYNGERRETESGGKASL